MEHGAMPSDSCAKAQVVWCMAQARANNPINSYLIQKKGYNF
jgi:hypothetical protein